MFQSTYWNSTPKRSAPNNWKSSFGPSGVVLCYRLRSSDHMGREVESRHGIGW
jgi:hypothetical protein